MEFTASQKITLQFVETQLELAMLEMSSSDLLMARERLALIVAALDFIAYPNG